MKPEQQRVAIAEACGWTDCHLPLASNQNLPFTERVLCGIAPDRITHSPLPDYLNDLNAMHDAEKTMSWEESVKFRLNLCDNSDGPNAKFRTVESAMCHAEASQRAEAFLKTLDLWKN